MGDRGSVALTLTTGDAGPGDPAPHVGDLEGEIAAAAGRLVSRWGIAKTTVADIANEAGCSRATVYRVFPGGKQELLETVGYSELQTFFDCLATLADDADNLEDALVAVIVASHQILADHPGFQFVLEHEPGLMLPFLGFHRIDLLYSTARERLSPHFRRFLGDEAPWGVEWVARIALSYLFQPSATVDLADPATVHALVRTRVIPGLTANLDVAALV